MNILIVLIIIVVIAVLLYISLRVFRKDCRVIDCVAAHQQDKIDYVWLNPLGHGKVLKVEFEEPVDSGNWTTYNEKWWKTHCEAVDHHPDNLVASHMKAFVNKGRFARLMFTFQDGTKMEPNKYFYELEAKYFRQHNKCGHYNIN